jgi:hypothetical protein
MAVYLEDGVVDVIGDHSPERHSMTDVAGQDAVLDFLICWHLACGEQGRPHVLAALRRWAGRREHVDNGGYGPRLWTWCTSVWLPGWMRAAGLPEQARAVERGADTMLPPARRAAGEAARQRTSGVNPVSTAITRARAFAVVEASGAAAVTCSGAADSQAHQALAAGRDAAHAALQSGIDIDQVVTRLRRAALALVDGLACDGSPDGDRASHIAIRSSVARSPRLAAPSPSALCGSRE